MTEHPIRFRGGWRWITREPTVEAARPVVLPIVWPEGLSAPVRLVRPFNRPPIPDGDETLGLRLESIPGLTSVRLNGLEIAHPPPGTSDLWLPLAEPLRGRNVLILDVVPPIATGARSSGTPWGAIALVIRSGRGESLGEPGPSA